MPVLSEVGHRIELLAFSQAGLSGVCWHIFLEGDWCCLRARWKVTKELSPVFWGCIVTRVHVVMKYLGMTGVARAYNALAVCVVMTYFGSIRIWWIWRQSRHISFFVIHTISDSNWYDVFSFHSAVHVLSKTTDSKVHIASYFTNTTSRLCCFEVFEVEICSHVLDECGHKSNFEQGLGRRVFQELAPNHNTRRESLGSWVPISTDSLKYLFLCACTKSPHISWTDQIENARLRNLTVVPGTRSHEYRSLMSSWAFIWTAFPWCLALWWFNNPSNMSDWCLYACYACVL